MYLNDEKKSPFLTDYNDGFRLLTEVENIRYTNPNDRFI